MDGFSNPLSSVPIHVLEENLLECRVRHDVRALVFIPDVGDGNFILS